MNLNNQNIPSLELLHNSEKVSFAFRTMEEVHAQLGNITDVPHRHNYYTVLWANNACGQHFIDYKEHLIQPNCIFFVNPGQVHQVITFGSPKGFVIMFTREYLQQNLIREDFLTNLGLFSESADTPPILIKEEDTEQLREITKKMQNTFHSDEAFKHEQLSSYLKLFLIECNKYAPRSVHENTQSLHSSRKIIKAFKTLVENMFTEWHKVSAYANELNITSDYLNSVVKSGIGKTAKEFIQLRICLEAKRLGLHTQLTSKEISFELGFDDPSHFSKFFKSIEGKSFSDFRKILSESLV